ncbi:MAG: phosphoglycolate phosphatase [Pseudomonadota bacterium]
MADVTTTGTANSAAVHIRTVLFDLDGTLLDTAPDLAAALNTVLLEHGRSALPFAAIRPVVSHGGAALIELGFGLAREHPEFEPLRARLLEVYRANLSRQTRPFAGMEAVLAALEARGLNWGVVTNKPAWLTEPLLRDLALYDRAVCVVSGDTLAQRKPHPAPLLLACRLAGSEPAQCVYIGDAERDVAAGRNAGMQTLVALFGYLQAHDDPRAWQASGSVSTPGGVLEWLDRRAAGS